MKTYKRKDGYTYFLQQDKDGQHLIACPTNSDGSMDKENSLYVDDFAYPLTHGQTEYIIRQLA